MSDPLTLAALAYQALNELVATVVLVVHVISGTPAPTDNAPNCTFEPADTCLMLGGDTNGGFREWETPDWRAVR
jgi:hypothetical protein